MRVAQVARSYLEQELARSPRITRLAQGLANVPGLAVDLERVQTNMVFLRITRPELDAAALTARLAAAHVLVSPADAHSLRAVTHLDVSTTDIDDAIARTARVLAAG